MPEEIARRRRGRFLSRCLLWRMVSERMKQVRMAIASPLLEVSIEGAKGVLFNIVGGSDLSMTEVNEAAQIIAQAADPDANIIFGATIKEDQLDQVKISVIATGFDETRRRLREYIGTGFATPPIQSQQSSYEEEKEE